MSGEVESTVVSKNPNNSRILLHRSLFAVLILIIAGSVYAFYVLIEFHLAVATLQQQGAFLFSKYPTEQGQLVTAEYGDLREKSLIPLTVRLYQYSLTGVYLRQPPGKPPADFDQQLKLLKQFPKLQVLGLEDITIDTARAEAIAELPALQRLNIEGCSFEESCLETILRRDGLERVSLEQSHFPEAELKALCQDSNQETLRKLNLSGCNVTDESTVFLSRLKNLETLVLDGTQITDQSLKILARLPKLNVLILDHTNVTDAGVSYLASTPNLVELSLSNTSVSDATLETLKQEIPALRVSDD
ncbi:leucine-rich repeat domain-containing protein [Gimesia fumaroli]|uniref:Leucine Rich repeats (2 copies) n=1 Tax=Gimesia fumaroli TaxID=2527976 RepID=A0A518IJX6_9PLAN|nr:hypothetical protein [Gimesia fumaroli]QDV53388.1 Leucine Rich repeats (2 copies) [Gimesia fumaroli]